MFRLRVIQATAAMLLLTAIFIGGCGGQAYNRGRKAELRGDYHIAYDEYCRAAAASPENESIASAIRRVATRSAEIWTAQGRAAEREGRFDAAWRMYARALEVRPGDESALACIRTLEHEHGDVTARARHDWIVRGHGALEGTSRADSGRVAAARRSDVDEAPERHVAARVPDDTAGDLTQEAAEPSEPAPAGPAAQVEAALSGNNLDQGSAKGASSLSRNSDRFLAIHVLSRKDRRFVKSVESVDGVTLKLIDTDDEGDADLNVYHGRRKIKQIRDIRIGQSVVFPGRSGRPLQLIILDIRHKSQTVRLGIKPA